MLVATYGEMVRYVFWGFYPTESVYFEYFEG